MATKTKKKKRNQRSTARLNTALDDLAARFPLGEIGNALMKHVEKAQW